MPSAIELKHERARLWSRMKELNDKAEAENRDLDAAERENWDKANSDISALDQRIARQEVLERTPASASEERRIPGRESAMQGNGNGAGHQDTRTLFGSDEYRDATRAYLRYGVAGLNEDQRSVIMRGMSLTPAGPGGEVRALSTVNSVAGGYIVAPNDFGADIERAMAWYGGMMEAAQTITTDDGAELPYPVSNDTANTGELVSENGAITEQDVTFGNVVLKAYMYSSKLVKVPYQLLQDAAFDIESFLSDAFGERIGRIQNTHFTVGVGGNQPEGIMSRTVQGVAAATGQTTVVMWDDLIDLEHSVNKAYRTGPGVRYMFHDSTLEALRKIKDGNGNYIWQPSTTANAPSLINGYPYTINNDMAEMAASQNSIVFGNLKKYKIRRVRGFTLLRLNELYAANMQVGFFAYARADGGLIDAGGNPVKHYTNSAT